tara:strand:- start:1208 stop:2071 length:864 start_codon:yes stop_codon:yes gene_type:complete
MKLRKMHIIGLIFGAVTAIVGAIFFLTSKDSNLFLFLMGIAGTIVIFPFIAGIVLENKRERQMNSMFLEFARNLAESVTTGTPVSKSIVNMRNKNFGPLTPHISKLSNQIELGIPVSRALETFANDVDSPVVKRAVALIREAERAGGEIDYILDSVAHSISEVEKLKKERKAAVYNLVVQGYIIFFIFIGIMLVMEFKIIPLTTGIGGFGTITDINALQNADLSQEAGFTAKDLTRPFLVLLLIQGFFVGLTIGKLAEGTMKAGVKHSFIMMIAAFLITSGARVILN